MVEGQHISFLQSLTKVDSKRVPAGRFGDIKIYANPTNGALYLVKKIKSSDYNTLEGVVHNVMKDNPIYIELFTQISSPESTSLMMPYYDTYRDLFVTLNDRSVGRLSSRRVREIARKVVYALAALHDKKIIHNDVKLENVLYEYDTEKIKICDYGLARIIGQENLHDGTLEYFSPEKIKQHPYSESFDWWAVGVMLHELITGKHPFHLEPPFRPPQLYVKILNTHVFANYIEAVADRDRDLAVNFIQALLNVASRRRLKNERVIKAHSYIRGGAYKGGGYF
jgi:serine/threonine protein kinase